MDDVLLGLRILYWWFALGFIPIFINGLKEKRVDKTADWLIIFCIIDLIKKILEHLYSIL